VRRLAAEQAVDLDRLAASTPGGRVSRADVRAAASADRNVLPDAPSRTEPLGAVRSVVAKRMAESARTVAPVTLTTEADATELVRLRARTKDDYAGDEAPPVPVPTVTDLIVRIVALALADHPELNASLTDDGIVRHAAAHVGIAVDTARGLLVPVIRDAGSKSAGRIAAESAGLIERARTGTATPDELRGGTFTVTNLGMYEIDAFTPIVNLPECAILGVGRIVARPVVVDEATDEVAVRRMMALSLTFDHRVVDGAPAARFLRDVKRLVEHPYRWLMR
jgi:pyruvate dehydrogenase E2 component (dihydrolipoamide acetyltransferase)